MAPYNWKQAKNVNWFPGLRGAKPGSIGSSILGSLPSGGPTAPNFFAPLAQSSLFGNRPGGGGGSNAAGLIGGMPDLSAMKAQIQAGSTADAASRDAALRRLVISYGAMPDLASLGISGDAAGFLKNAINDQVMQLAQKNEAEGTSVHARMQHEADVGARRVPAALAGRGMLHSGQTGVDLAEQAQQAKNQQFDTLNELLGNVENVTSSFLQAERDRAMQLAEMEMQAAMSQYQNYADSDLGYDPYANMNTGVQRPVNVGALRGRVPSYSFVGAGNLGRIRGLMTSPRGQISKPRGTYGV